MPTDPRINKLLKVMGLNPGTKRLSKNYSSPGQILTAVGAFVGSFPLMQFSRFVFGIGGESLSVAQNTYASAWFSGDALNMVFGLQVRMA